MNLSDVARWLRRELEHERRLLHDLTTIRWPNKAQRDRLWQLAEDGGLALTRDLVPLADGKPRAARILLQLDGDALLIVPKNLVARPDDATGVTGLLAALANEIAALHATLPYNLAALISVALKLASFAVAAVPAPGATRSLLAWIEQAGTGQVEPVAWWNVAGTVCGLLGFAFGRSIRRGITRGLGWLFGRGFRRAT